VKRSLDHRAKENLTRLALQLFCEWLKNSEPFKLIFAEIKHFIEAEVAQNAEKRSKNLPRTDFT